MTTAPGPARIRWRGLAAWALFGALAGLSVLGILTIGIFVAPFALVLLAILLSRRVPHAAPGILAGLGVLLVWVSWVNRIESAATCSGSSDTPDTCSRVVVPWVWLVPALLCLVAAALLLTRSRRVPD
ncbi:MAG: hypothetical protein V9G19_25220 [Tetrasphaera sp.]